MVKTLILKRFADAEALRDDIAAIVEDHHQGSLTSLKSAYLECFKLDVVQVTRLLDNDIEKAKENLARIDSTLDHKKQVSDFDKTLRSSCFERKFRSLR